MGLKRVAGIEFFQRIHRLSSACLGLVPIALGVIAILCALPASAQRFVYNTTWGDRGKDNTTITRPGAFTVLSDGHILVNESSSNPIVTELTADGTFVRTIGTKGNGPGQFMWPTGMTQLSDGTLVIGDYWSERLQRFTRNGTFISQFNGDDGVHPRFGRPHGICRDSDDNIYVVGENAGVWVYRPDGTYVRHWNTTSYGVVVEDIVLGPDDLLYVSFSYGAGVVVFRKDGTYVRQFNGTKNGDLPMQGTIGLRFDKYGNLYAADTERAQVRVFTRDGNQITKIGGPGTGNGQFTRPIMAQPLPDGRVLVSEENRGNIQVFQMVRPTYRFKSKFRPASSPHGVKGDVDGSILIGATNGYVYRYSTEGNQLSGFYAGNGWLHGVDTLSDGTIAVAIRGENKIGWFRPDGTLLRSYPLPGQSYGLYVDKLDRTYAPNSGGTIPVYSQDFSLLRTYLSPSGWNWNSPVDICPADGGDWWIADHFNDLMLRMDSSGQKIGTHGHVVGGNLRPNGITMTRAGWLVVSAQLLLELHLFDESGVRQFRLGNSNGGGQFGGNGITDVSEGIDGNLYVAGLVDGHVHIWEPVYDLLPPTSTLTLSPTTPASSWHTTTPVTVSITASDDSGGGGVKEIRYAVNMGTEQVVAGASASFPISSEGIHSVAYWAVDNGGIAETTRYATVKIDKTAPSVSHGLSGKVLTFTSGDTLSGVAWVKYKVDSGAEQTYTGPVTLPASARTITFRAQDNAGNTTAAQTVAVGPLLKSLTFTPAGSASSGASVTVRVTLVVPAPTGGLSIGLGSSHPSVLPLPANLAVPAGASTVSVPVVLGPVGSPTTVRATASWAGTSVIGNLAVQLPRLKSLTVTPGTVTGGNSATATATLIAKAPAGGVVVNVESLDASASVPATVTIPAGALSVKFTVSTALVSDDKAVLLRGSTGGTAVVATLALRRVGPSAVTCTPPRVTGGQTTTVKVTLTRPAPAGGLTVTFTSSSPAAVVPPTATVPAGTTSTTVVVTTSAVPVDDLALLEATAGGLAASVSLTIAAPQLGGLVLLPTSVTGGLSSTGTVALTGPAPSGGAVVVLASSKAEASIPATVTVPAGATSVSFTVTTTAVSVDTTAVITASLQGVSKSASLGVKK